MIFNRVQRLVGNDGIKRLAESKVIIFGVGGVGSWTAESLVRTGVGHLTIVDADCVAESNINRQSMAFVSTVGKPKVELLKQRLLDINPQAEITAIHGLYNEATADDYDLNQYDCVIDAIDSLADKALLINRATRAHTKLFSSMGAALKFDPTRIHVAEFWDVKGCPLAAALRNRFKRSGVRPAKKFKCVYSDELLTNHPDADEDSSGAMSFQKKQINGAVCHITAIFGFTLAGLVLKQLQLLRKQ